MIKEKEIGINGIKIRVVKGVTESTITISTNEGTILIRHKIVMQGAFGDNGLEVIIEHSKGTDVL